MGWLWAKPPSTSPSGKTDPITTTTTTTTTTDQSKPAHSTTQSTDAGYSDPEIALFMAQLQAELVNPRPASAPEPEKSATSTTMTTSTTGTQPSQSSSSSSSWSSILDSTSSNATHGTLSSSSRQEQKNKLDPLSESLLPTSMSCRQAFDMAYHCNSVGGQLTSVYRSGAVRSCSDKWDDFWFCMRTRSAAVSGLAKQEAIRDHYRRRELGRYYGGPDATPSSTDVWEPRTERLEPGEAFSQKFDRPSLSDEEWWRLEIERRRYVRAMLEREQAAKHAS